MIETTCPVRIFAQYVCWESFHSITPSVSSMWFLLSSTYMLYFLVFLSKDVSLKVCTTYSELKEFTQINILSSTRQFMVSQKLIKCSNRKFSTSKLTKCETHNLTSGIKSEDTYGYVLDYTKPLTCIGCHIRFIFISSDRVWLNILLDNKNRRYRHWNRLPMLLCSKTTGYLIFWRLC